VEIADHAAGRELLPTYAHSLRCYQKTTPAVMGSTAICSGATRKPLRCCIGRLQRDGQPTPPVW
jgi:hypothetical protein